MKTLMLTLTLMAIACGVAHADELKNPDAPQSLAALWPMIGLAIGNLNAYLSRRLSSAFTFFHTPAGALVLSAEGAVIAAIVPVIQAHGLVWASLAWAAVGALTSFLATLNPSTTEANPPAKSPRARMRVSDSALVALMAIGVIGMFAGCATPGGQALGKCELGQLPQQLEPTIADVVVIAETAGANYQQQLESLGATLAPGQVECVVQAIVAAWSAGHGRMAADRAAALQRLQQFLAAHPAKACAGRVAL